MDLPQLLHHHSQNPSSSRGVTVSNTSRPQHPDEPHPHPQFQSPHHSSENHTRYQNYQIHPQNHHQQQRNAQPPMRPQTPPFQAPVQHQQSSPFKGPGFRGYSSVQSEIGFANSGCDRGFEDDRARSSFSQRDFSNQANLSHRRLVVDDDRPRNRLPEFKMENRPYDQPRAMAENHSPRQYQPPSPYKMNNRLRQEPENSSRFKLECGELIRPRRGNLVSSPGKSFRDVEFVSGPGLSRRDSESEGYNGRYEKETFRNVNQRWVNERKVHREVHNSSFERGNSQINNGNGNGNGSHFVSGKREFYGPESGNFVRGDREDSQEYNRNPRKQFQKKSALLRLQKPNHRNAENGQFHHYGNHDCSNPSFYRRRDQYIHRDGEMEVQERVANPVELDVSFKSNSLVAKAVVTLTSASDNINTDLAPTTLEGSDNHVSNMECSNAERTQLSCNPVYMDGNPCTTNIVSTLDKERVDSAEKVNSDVEICEIGPLNSETLSVGNQLLEKNEVQRKADSGFDSSKPSVKVVKKKKVVKKIVKKVLRPRSHVLSSEQKKKPRETQNYANNLKTRADRDGLGMREEQQSVDVIKCLVNTQTSGNEKDLESHENMPSLIANLVIGDSLSVDNSGFLPITLPTSENVDSPSLNSESTKMYENGTGALYPTNSTDSALNGVYGTESSQEEILVQEEILKTTSYIEESNANEDFRGKIMSRNELGFCRASEDGLDSTIVSNTNTAVDTTVNLSSPSQSYGVAASSLGSLDDNISEDKLIATDGINFDVTSIPCSKRRKVSASQSPSQTDDKTVDASTSCIKPQLSSNEVSVHIPMECDNGINDLQDEKIVSVPEEQKTVEPFSSANMVSDNCLIQDSSPDDQLGTIIKASDSVPDFLSTQGYIQTLLSVPDSNPAGASPVSQTSYEVSMQKKNSNLRSQNSISAISETHLVSDCTTASDQRGSNLSRTFTSFKPFTLKKKPTAKNARTWHRNLPSSTSLLPGSNPIPSTSYVRKGNSLVRNPSPAIGLSQSSGSSPVHKLNSSGLDESKKKPHSDFTPSPLAGSLSKSVPTSPSEASDTPTLTEVLPTSEASENRNGQCNNPDNQNELTSGNLSSLNPKKIVYVKRKSNQLVATSDSVDLPLVNAAKIQTSSFDGYYKRRKNQLIRTSGESGIGQPVCMSGKNTRGQITINPDSRMRLSKRRSQKVFTKMFKRSANSLVWTLRSGQSTEKDYGLSNHQKVFSHLFPWKRTPYWRTAMHNLNMVSKSRSSIAISSKLLLSRRRDTLYTRSINGFSLRKSKVLSVGGSSLKWSKSIESHSKKANEEATIAVAAVEKKKREQKGAACISSGPKTRNHSSRERIFRIGSSRYKMDPSRRTLQRISDDEMSSEPSTRPDKGAMTSCIPRRLVIGYNEYIRIGNGNKLIRDPKKRSRALASEKVRWSLLTARLRLVKKKTYCQFFTKFGRCNKENGRCPYLHDPSKIAVCTKFLNGSCPSNNCKLTHKVIPERMPDCSYFLQGLCSNQNCHYRHVSVNPKASTCEAFLKGYCADGDECRKKHSYVCPAFEATGICSEGSKCKLHHPRSRSKGKKRKQLREIKNLRGRYFGSPDNVISERETPEKLLAQEDSNDASLEGECADYIALDFSNDDDDDTRERNILQMTHCESDISSDSEELEDLDEIIKPVLLMNRNLTT